MGIMQHHTVVATTWSEEEFERVQSWCLQQPSEFFAFQSKPAMNHYQAIVLLPDGSKEGWTDSEEGDQRRQQFLAVLREADNDDGSNPWAWVEVTFGEIEVSIVEPPAKVEAAS